MKTFQYYARGMKTGIWNWPRMVVWAQQGNDFSYPKQQGEYSQPWVIRPKYSTRYHEYQAKSELLRRRS